MDEVRKQIEQLVRETESASRDDLSMPRRKIKPLATYQRRILQGTLVAFLAGVSGYAAMVGKQETVNYTFSDTQIQSLRSLGFTPYLVQANTLAKELKENDNPDVRRRYQETIETLEILEQHRQVEAQHLGIAGIVRASIEMHYRNPIFNAEPHPSAAQYNAARAASIEEHPK